jgi:RNA polymerase sigma-70 factor (ECF subfamily)
VSHPRSSKGPAGRARLDLLRGETRADRRVLTSAALEEIEGPDKDDAGIVALVDRARSGDDLAFAELYIRLVDRVYRYSVIALKNRDDAQEVTQQVFTKIFEALPRYRDVGRPFRSWVFVIARNECIKFLHRTRRADPTDPAALVAVQDSLAARADDVVPTNAEASSIQAAIEKLPPKQRRVLTLRFVYEMTPAGIAELLGTTPDAVRHVQHRALRTLARELERDVQFAA